VPATPVTTTIHHRPTTQGHRAGRRLPGSDRPATAGDGKARPAPAVALAANARRRRSLMRRIDHAIAARRRAVERLDALARELAALDGES